ncbi:unnamed protein product, partial [Mesorhabditis spiculigera]
MAARYLLSTVLLGLATVGYCRIESSSPKAAGIYEGRKLYTQPAINANFSGLFDEAAANRVGYKINPAFSCRDKTIENIITTALRSYVHDMDSITRYALDQLRANRPLGTWLVHAQVISTSRQGPDWQTSTNGRVFQGTDFDSCFYHDQQTYILVLRLYVPKGNEQIA